MLKNLENLAAKNPALYHAIVDQIKGEIYQFTCIYCWIYQQIVLVHQVDAEPIQDYSNEDDVDAYLDEEMIVRDQEPNPEETVLAGSNDAVDRSAQNQNGFHQELQSSKQGNKLSRAVLSAYKTNFLFAPKWAY